MVTELKQSASPLPLSLLMTRDAFQVDPKQPMGRQSAGASFLEAYLHHSGNTKHSVVVSNGADAKWFHSQASGVHGNARTTAMPLERWGDAASSTGAIHIPDPGLNHWAWKRMPWGDGSYSIIGIVHTLCSYSVQHALGQFSSAPIRPWDALICTSHAARQVVEGFLERQENWLEHRNGACRFERPQLPVIPLGINPEAWVPPVSKAASSETSRAQLGIRAEAEVVLLAGRLDLLTKFNPAPLVQCLAELQQTQHPDLELLVYGEAPSAEMLQLWKKTIRQMAPSLTTHWVPGRSIDLAGPVRWAADVFVSLSDNPQETFGITPLEAMAAELPCLVSDWDGYKESVVQPGESDEATGLRVTTRMVSGLGAQEAQQMLTQERSDYSQSIGRIAQGIAVDLDEFKHHLSTLLNAPKLRAAMGAAGRRRVEMQYSWRVVIKQWQALVADLTARRQHALSMSLHTPAQLPPWMPDTSTGFGCFASQILHAEWSPAPPNTALEQQRMSNRFQSWDRNLLQRTDARRLGWWLKQGLIKP